MAAKFGSKIGMIAATVGSAVGLGNIWRFPAETQANGGAAFLLVYIGCVLLLGIPVMLVEFSIGREGGTDAIGNYRRISPKSKWWLLGGMGIAASYMILTFYIVVAGWTLEYFVSALSGDLFTGIADGSASFEGKMKDYVSSDWKPIIFTILMIAANVAVLMMGVRKGIEKISNIMMPLLFLILVIFCVVALSLPGASDGLNFFLNPDFSKVNGSVVIDAMGQAFFSLSLGMGVLSTYAAYFPRDTRLGRTAATVSFLDMVVAFMMGLIIFPAVTSFGMQGESLEGATLVFVTLPEVFTRMPGTQLWAILFFMLLLLAALTSTISMSEVAIRFFQDRLKMSRRKAVLIVMLPLLLFGAINSLSSGLLADFKIFGLTIFDLLDTVATNIMLPLGALAMCLYAGWFAPKGLLARQLSNDARSQGVATRAVIFIIRWVSPIAIAAILIAQFK